MKKIILTTIIGIAIVAAVAVAMAARHHSAPVVGSYFEPDSDSLRHMSSGLVILRPTHFPFLSGDMRHLHEDSSSVTRTVGRNEPLRNVIAEACDCTPSRVVLPPDAPPGGYDYLVTTGPKALEDLQSAVEKNLGYVVHHESRVVDVLAVKVQDPTLPGLTMSHGQWADETVKDGKPYMIDRPMNAILDSLSQGLDKPTVDETGLTNCYDYSMTWNNGAKKKMKGGAAALETARQVLGGWGLTLEPATESIDMVIVEKSAVSGK